MSHMISPTRRPQRELSECARRQPGTDCKEKSSEDSSHTQQKRVGRTKTGAIEVAARKTTDKNQWIGTAPASASSKAGVVSTQIIKFRPAPVRRGGGGHLPDTSQPAPKHHYRKSEYEQEKESNAY